MISNIFLIWVSALSLIGLVALLAWKIYDNRKRNIDYSQFEDYSVTHLIVDYVAFRIVYFCKETIYKFFVFSVHFVKNCLSVFRYLIFRAEKRFLQITESMQERQIVHKNGPVSSFLQEIKDHKETAMSEAQNGESPDLEEGPDPLVPKNLDNFKIGKED